MDIDLAQVERCLNKEVAVLTRDEACQMLLQEGVDALDAGKAALRKAIDEQLQKVLGEDKPFCVGKESSSEGALNCVDSKFLLAAKDKTLADYKSKISVAEAFYKDKSEALSKARTLFNSYSQEYAQSKNQVCARISPGIDSVCVNRKAVAKEQHERYKESLAEAETAFNDAESSLNDLKQEQKACKDKLDHLFKLTSDLEFMSTMRGTAADVLSQIEIATDWSKNEASKPDFDVEEPALEL